MTYRELTRKLRRLDCEFSRQGKGDHEIWRSNRTRRTSPIPYWGSRDLKSGTVSRILRNLEISQRDFDRA